MLTKCSQKWQARQAGVELFGCNVLVLADDAPTRCANRVANAASGEEAAPEPCGEGAPMPTEEIG